MAGDEHAAAMLTLARGADHVRAEFEAELEPRLSELGELGGMSDWGGKLVGAVMRIAGILHLAEHVADPAPWRLPIAESTLERAVTVGRYLIPHATAAYAAMGADPQLEGAKYLLAWLLERGVTRITRRNLFQGVRGRFPKIADLAPPLALLIEHGYLRERETLRDPDKKPAGRKPSPVYDLNPLAQNSHNPQNTAQRAHSEDSEDSELTAWGEA